jgi:hypothetical protein
MRIEESLALVWERIDFERLCMKVDEATVHGRAGPVKTEYSDDELPLDPDFATKLLSCSWPAMRKIRASCFQAASPGSTPTHRRPSRTGSGAGWCLVKCPECGAAPGVRCTGFPVKRHARPLIGVHQVRREAATAAGYGGIGWHTFRHKYQTLRRKHNTHLDVQQRLMRHSDIQTTAQYAEMPMENQRLANSQAVRPILVRKSLK